MRSCECASGNPQNLLREVMLGPNIWKSGIYRLLYICNPQKLYLYQQSWSYGKLIKRESLSKRWSNYLYNYFTWGAFKYNIYLHRLEWILKTHFITTVTPPCLKRPRTWWDRHLRSRRPSSRRLRQARWKCFSHGFGDGGIYSSIIF